MSEGDVENDDQWLYGDNPEINPEPEDSEREKSPQPEPEEDEAETAPPPDPPEEADIAPPGVDEEEKPPETEENDEEGEVEQNGDDDSDKDLDSDDSDDDVNVVIGDIKSTPSYTSLNIKRGGLISSSTAVDKTKAAPQPGKFSVDEFDQTGTINGVPATEYNLDSLEDKPWRKPGADITDYFNYGFNEDTWRAYCERQKRMRVNESGVGLAPMNPTGMNRAGPVPIMNENSKYTGNIIVGPGHRNMSNNPNKGDQPKMNTIQVMTADRREYSRKPAAFPDMSVPPPTTFEDYQPEYGFNPEPEPFYGGYEPTQESQWTVDANPGWTPEIKSLTPNIPVGPPPHMHMAPPQMGLNVPPPVPAPAVPVMRDSPRAESREHEKERESSRSRSEKPRDRERERSHRRERSRSRSRRHKSRSRSPSHRSHRKKKSRRHEDSD